MSLATRKKIGLAFSGGGARGLAHVGVLKVFDEAGIQVDCIAGTSMGGVIAAAYACGIPVSEIEAKALKLSHMKELMKLVEVAAPRRGLLRIDRVREFLSDLFVDRVFEHLPVRLAIPCTDIVEAREIVFTSGLVFPAVLATIAVPGLFEPYEFGPYRLVDGGILNNLPVDRVREIGADIIIGVDVQFNPKVDKPWQDLPERPHFPVPVPDFFLNFYRAELIMVAELTEAHLKICPPDLLLRPPIPLDITMFLGFSRIPEAIAAGEQAARNAIPEIIRLIDQPD